MPKFGFSLLLLGQTSLCYTNKYPKCRLIFWVKTPPVMLSDAKNRLMFIERSFQRLLIYTSSLWSILLRNWLTLVLISNVILVWPWRFAQHDVASFVWHFYKTVMFKLRFAFMLNLIELEHKQTTPKTLN